MVIKVVSDKPLKTKKVICGNCSYELEYTGEDVISQGGYYMGEYDIDFYIKCPRENCNHKTRVKAWSNKDA